jgi:hypothetical protein
LKFGILINRYQIQRWQREVLERLITEGHECRFVVINDNPAAGSGFWDRIRHYPYRLLLYRVYWRFLMKIPSLRLVDSSDLLQDTAELRCKTSRQGSAMHFYDDDLAIIHSFKADFILRFGFSIIKGGILEAARYGVWSFHHDDPEQYRGVPTGFHEILQNNPVNGAILQRLGDRIDGGDVLYKGYFGTRLHSWQGNLDHLLSSTVEWPALVCRRIELHGFEAVKEQVCKPGKLYKLPGNLLMIKFLIVILRNRMRFHFKELFMQERWVSGVSHVNIDSLIQPGEVLLPEPELLIRGESRSTYHADPFGAVLPEGVLILSEHYCYQRQKGVIVSQYFDHELRHLLSKERALDLEGHLAFPYLFKHEGDIFCLPENADGGHVDLFLYNHQTGKLDFHHRIIPDWEGIDGTLFPHEGVWYYLCTDRRSTNERLHIWHAEQMEGPYYPHPLNPVKTDIRSARPAGRPFLHNGKLLRPTQDCSVRSGWRINIQEITHLSPTLFTEKDFAVINAPVINGKSMKGIHTFSVGDGLLVTDFKEGVFVAAAFARVIHRKLKRLQSKIGA